MKNAHSLSIVLITLVSLSSCKKAESELSVNSPNGDNQIRFALSTEGSPRYAVSHGGQEVILPSALGFEFQGQPALVSGMEVTSWEVSESDETWEMPWGEQRSVRNHYNELTVDLQESNAPGRGLRLYFRAYDDGVAYRYELLAQQETDTVIISDELSEFRLTGDHMAWWIPGDWDIYEHKYITTRISGIDAISKRDHPDLASTYIPENAVNTPVTLRTDSGLHLSLHEAALTDYAGMTLKVDTENHVLSSELVGSSRYGYKVKRALPFKTPWRSLQISGDAAGLIASNLIVNLNEPNAIGDVSWFKPMKYNGIWWEMHLGLSTWDMEATQDMNTFSTLGNEQTSTRHGATTENTRRYIDFAAANGLGGVLVEGWNTGWDRWIGFEDREGVFDFITPYADYDLPEVVRYAREKGVQIIMHHETSAAPRTYEQQLDTAYRLMNSLGIHSVKTGYVGPIIPKGEHHHGQWMVNHYRKVLETGAKYQVAINAHEPIKPTGIRRTYPNAISREGLRGQEFNAWATDGGNPPEHLPIVAFTRMLAGPIDFTPGAFELTLPTKPENQINTTLAQQLALYVVIYSPIQMACDLPENYEGNPALQFIRDVGVDWEQSLVLHGEVGDFVTIAREERETGNWFVGGITDESARELTVDFDFLEEGVTYRAVFYTDGESAHYRNNPTALEIESLEVTRGQSHTFRLAEGGGFAVSLLRTN